MGERFRFVTCRNDICELGLLWMFKTDRSMEKSCFRDAWRGRENGNLRAAFDLSSRRTIRLLQESS